MRPLCKVPRSEIPLAVFPLQHLRTHIYTHVHMLACAHVQPHMLTHACVHCSCVQTHVPIPTHRLPHTPVHDMLHTAHAHTGVCTHSHTHTPHTDSVSSRQHVTSCQAHVGLKFPEAGAPGRGYLISDLQFVGWAEPGLCPDSSFPGPQWRVGAGECSCSDRAELL